MKDLFTKVFGPKTLAIKTFLAIGMLLILTSSRASGDHNYYQALIGYLFTLPAFLYLKA